MICYQERIKMSDKSLIIRMSKLITLMGASLIASGCALEEDYSLMEINKKPLIIDHFNPEEDDMDNKEVYEIFLEVYDNASHNWDRFNEQFERISSIRITSEPMELAAKTIKRKIILSSTLDDILIHEMAHVWHFSLRKRERENFESEWLNKIEPVYNFEACRRNKDTSLCNYHTRRSASVKNYGGANIYEDIATTVQLVYLLTNPHYNLPGFPNEEPNFRTRTTDTEETPETTITINNVPRVKNKIELLAKYGFISERERDYVLRELDNFNEE